MTPHKLPTLALFMNSFSFPKFILRRINILASPAFTRKFMLLCAPLSETFASFRTQEPLPKVGLRKHLSLTVLSFQWRSRVTFFKSPHKKSRVNVRNKSRQVLDLTGNQRDYLCSSLLPVSTCSICAASTRRFLLPVKYVCPVHSRFF